MDLSMLSPCKNAEDISVVLTIHPFITFSASIILNVLLPIVGESLRTITSY